MLRRTAAAFLAAALAITAACDGKQQQPPEPRILHAQGTLRVLAGSELEDMSGILADLKAATGVTVELSYIGTLAGVEQVTSGAAAENFDAVWFGTNQYLNFRPGASSRIADAKPIMRSPVIIGVRDSAATQLGWTGGNQPSWKDIADAAASGRLGFGMTNPATSNSGFSGLLSVTAGIAGTTPESLTGDQIHTARSEIRKFFGAQRLVSGSSGWLADAYASRAATEPDLNALINYESVLLSLDEKAKSGALAPLTPIYPKDGAVVADYPLTLLSGTSDEVRQRYDAAISYLRQRKTQGDIRTRTHRRPVVSGVTDDGPAVTARSVPTDSAVADALLSEFGSNLRRPARTIYVLDVSGSMVENKIDPSNPNSGTRLDALQEALRGLTRADPALSSQVLGFQQREQVVLLPFSTKVRTPQTFEIPADAAAAGAALRNIKQAAGNLSAGGATAVYDALTRAYQIAGDQGGDNPYTTIVLLSDGERTTGLTASDFAGRYPSLPAAAEPRVPVFPVLFGTAREDEMSRLADLTGGLVFDARKKTSLVDVFREIRGYQ